MSTSPPPVVRGDAQQVADGVFVIPDNRVELVPNVGIVLGDRAALVVDAGLGPRNGAYVLEQAQRLAGGRELYLTITHFHPEHGFGAQAFKGKATIIYNAAQRAELQRKGPSYLEMFSGLSPAVAAELRGTELVDPDQVYDSETTLDLGGRSVLLRQVGPAHTLSDQVALVDDRVLFGGDLFETRIFPIAPFFPPYDADVNGSRWITVLDQLAQLRPTVVVPGHGEVTGISLIGDVREFLEWVRTETGRLQAGGTSADEVATTINQDARARWPRWERPEWIGLAARSFYAANEASR